MSLPEAVYLKLPAPLKAVALVGYSAVLRHRRYGLFSRIPTYDIAKEGRRPRTELLREQEGAFVAVVETARTRSPFYRERLRDLGPVRCFADARDLPVTTKHDLRSDWRRLLHQDHDPSKMIAEQTAGTTGTPVTICMTPEGYRTRYAMTRAVKHLYGWQPGDTTARFGGRMVVPYKQEKPPFWIPDYVGRQVLFSAYHLKEEWIEQYVCRLARMRPTEITGFSSSIYAVADYCVRHNVTDIRPARVLTDSESLLSYQRDSIEEAFGQRVVDTYGLSELGIVAAQCPLGRYHYYPHICYLEILDDEGKPVPPGEKGAIHATKLFDTGMSLLRYNTGDVGSLPEDLCECGQNTPILDDLEGRCEDIFITGDGRRMVRLDYIFKGQLPVKECQIVQKAVDDYLFRITPLDGFDASTEEIIRKKALDRLGETATIEFELVDYIPRSKSGKFIGVVSMHNNEL